MTDQRKLFFALLSSGLLNIALIVYVAYDCVRDRAPIAHYSNLVTAEKKHDFARIDGRTNEDVITALKGMEFQQLIESLENKALVEDGYAVRDLSLACLLSDQHFDLSRALLGQLQPVQKRVFQRSDQTEILLYRGLTEEQFAAILHFAKTERWPITPEGMFYLLQNKPSQAEPSLFEAFYLTPEFLAIETLFSRGDAIVGRADITGLLLDGDWSLLSTLSLQQDVKESIVQRRRHLILSYLVAGSTYAAKIALKTDQEFFRKKADDATVTQLLELLDPFLEETKQFTFDLLQSSRSDRVQELAAKVLYLSSGETAPDSLVLEKVLERFGARENALLEQQTIHHVRKGDSLWKISRDYGVSIEAIKELNALQTEVLRPGNQLRIPDKEKKYYSR